MAKFITYVKNLKADIAISSHPFVDASLDRMEIIRECNDRRGRQDQCGPHNPFLIGKEAASTLLRDHGSVFGGTNETARKLG